MINRLKRFLSPRNPLRLLWHHGKAFVAAALNGFPARTLTVIGVTGTDGKTTTVGMIAHILNEHGYAVGALSTAFFRVREEISWNATQKTSPSPFTVQRFLRRLVREGCTHAVLECSSHGLVQGRNFWTWPSVAAITNTSFEHLDYHGSMEQYRRDKAILFRMLRKDGTKVLHREDATYDRYSTLKSGRTIVYAEHAPDTFPRGNSSADLFLWIANAVGSPKGSRAELRVWEERTAKDHAPRPLELTIPGTFNLENALCAVACASSVGVSFEQSLDALRSFGGVPGRLEAIDAGQPFAVFVDFTVTPVAYEKTLKALRGIMAPESRLLVLTGSCGDRMREKRPEVGRICGELADVVIVSNEDPYTENPARIIDEVWSGIDQSKTEAHKIPDRTEAIRLLFALAKPGDVVLLSGKGSDTTMMVKEGQIPWNERAIARSLLEETMPR